MVGFAARRRRVTQSVGALLLLSGLAACSAGAPAGDGSAQPTAIPSPTVSPTASPMPTWDPDASADFAAEIFPITGTGDYVMYLDGQGLEAGSAGSSVRSDVAPGDYELRVACRADAENSITITLTSDNAATTVLSAPCDERVETQPVGTASTGVTLAVSGAGDQPVVWAAVLATTLAP